MSQITYLKGRFLPHEEAYVHVEDRGFLFADGIYDFVLVHRGKMVNLEGHLDRIDYSLGEMEIRWPMPRKELVDVFAEAIRRNALGEGFVYLQVTRGVAPRNHAFPREEVSPTVLVIARHVPFPTLEEARSGAKVITVPDQRWKRCDIKSIAILPNALAREKAVRAGTDEAWMYDEEGFITEGPACNAWIVTAEGELLTRQLDQAILSGVTRRMLLGVCRDNGVRFAERRFTVDEAKAAREAFWTNSPTLIRPVVQIDDTVIGDGKGGPFTLRLLDAYRAFVERQCAG
jgi:D-alanine transaminase